MKYILAILLAFSPFYLAAQKFQWDLYAGVANYQGDLQGRRFTFEQSKPSIGLGLSYGFTPHFLVRGAAHYMTVSGDDKNNTKATGILYRNLNFTSKIWEAQLAVEYQLFNIQERSFTPYIFAGIAAFHFNPYSFDSLGTKVYLRSLSTEGQGLAAYPDRKPYKNNQIAIPFGGGLKLAISPKITVGVELGLRKLFTDYLDDVSTTYVDSATLFAAKGAQAIEFAYRGSEIHGAPPYPAAGSQRGNPKIKDWYYTTVFRMSFNLGYNFTAGKKNKLGCPVNIY